MGLAKYGEMATLHLGSKTWIMLNSRCVVSEIIAKSSSLTNGRSPMPIACVIVSRNGRSLLLPPSQWMEKRRVMHAESKRLIGFRPTLRFACGGGFTIPCHIGHHLLS